MAVPNIPRTAMHVIAIIKLLLKFILSVKSVENKINIDTGPAISNESEVIVIELIPDK